MLYNLTTHFSLPYSTQTVKLGPHLSSTITLITGSPKGYVLSQLLYSLYTHDCTPTHPTNTIIKFADDTTVIGLISLDDESAYRDEVKKCRSGPTPHQRGLCGEGPHLQVPRSLLNRWPLMVCQHLRDSQKGTAATTLPESTQEKQPGV